MRTVTCIECGEEFEMIIVKPYVLSKQEYASLNCLDCLEKVKVMLEMRRLFG